MKRDVIFYIRLIIMLIALVGAIAGMNTGNITPVFVLVLFFALNMQLRIIFYKEKLFVLSLFIDLLLVFFMKEAAGELIYILVFVTLLDGIVYIERYALAFTLVSGIMLAYLVGYESTEKIILNTFAFIIITVLGNLYRLMNKKISKLEYLYDDVRKYSYELEHAKKQIESYSSQVESMASIKERQRISEEIHDTIGHRLTALLMQLEAGVRLLEIDEAEAKNLLGMSVDNLRECIDVLRQTVRSIKPKGYKNIIYSLEEMIRKFKRETDVNVELKVDGAIAKLYPGVEMVLFKNAQEAITNAVRHGQAKNIHMTLSYRADRVVLTVKDDGVGTINIIKGMGISSMEERLRFVGGSLKIQTDEGFVIICSIPIKESLDVV